MSHQINLLPKKSQLLVKTKPSTTHSHSHTPSTTTTITAKDIKMDVIFENERGSVLYGSASFTKKGLLPTDSPPFSDLKGAFCVDIRYFQCPPTWEFISDWILDLNGKVDDQGWSYADNYNQPQAAWTASFNPAKTYIVRRRKWTRMRRLQSSSSPKKPIFPTDASITQLNSISSIVQTKKIDRDRVLALKQYLTENEVSTVLQDFDFECSRVSACLLFTEQAKNDERIFEACLSGLRFYSDKRKLCDRVGVPFPSGSAEVMEEAEDFS